MVSIKKVLLTSLLATTTIFATACSSSNVKKEDVTAKVEITKEDVVKKLEESIKIKSADVDLDMKVNFSLAGLNAGTTISGKVSTITEPKLSAFSDLKTTFTGEAKEPEENIKMYIVDDVVYLNNDGKWVKTSDARALEQAKRNNDLSQTEFVELLKKSSDKLKLETQGDNYALSYDGDGNDFNEYLAKQLSGAIGEANIAEVVKNINFKSFKIVYLLDKKTFEPREQKVDTTFTLTSDGLTGDASVNSVMKYSNVNKVSAITLPEEAKNAEELQPIKN